MTPKEQYNKLVSEKVIKTMESRGIEAFYCESKEAALKKILELIPDESSVAWGGSESIKELGLISALYDGNYNLLDRAKAKNQDEIDEIYRKAFFSDFYLMSTNAFTIDGKLVNIDGTGNRVASMIYGPKNVIIVAGMNKLEMNEENAILRAHSKAAGINALRLDKETPCGKTGICSECIGEDCICCQVVITRKSKPKGRIKVILVGDELGY